MTITLFRAPHAILPFRFDESGMIRQRIDAAACSGVLEGDTVVGVAGAPIVRGAIDSPHYGAMLALRVGGAVNVDVIRPGAGKIAASVRCIENPCTFRALPHRDTSKYGKLRLATDKRTGAPKWEVIEDDGEWRTFPTSAPTATSRSSEPGS